MNLRPDAIGEGIGVFITKAELKELKKIISNVRPVLNTVIKDSYGGMKAYHDIDTSIKDFVEDLRKAYRLPEGSYGVNQFGEFVLYISLK